MKQKLAIGPCYQPTIDELHDIRVNSPVEEQSCLPATSASTPCAKNLLKDLESAFPASRLRPKVSGPVRRKILAEVRQLMRKQFGEASRKPLPGLTGQPAPSVQSSGKTRRPASPNRLDMGPWGRAVERRLQSIAPSCLSEARLCSRSIPPSTHPTPESSHE